MTKSEYYKGKLDRHREAAAHHAGMAEQGIHVAYHKEQEDRHLKEIDKLERKTDNKKKGNNQRTGASVTGGSLSPVSSGIPNSGPGGMPTP